MKKSLKPLLNDDLIIAVCLNGGGDMQMATKENVNFTWKIGIEDPDKINKYCATVELANGALATSGFSKRGRHVKQKNNSQVKQVTIVSKDLSVADVWATAGLSGTSDDLKDMISKNHLSGFFVDHYGPQFFDYGELRV
ncbi:FAD:protein FMN transferase [Streptococcus urinalis]|nr:FAD:protein FMN transferase [Streptococcus urinalis]